MAAMEAAAALATASGDSEFASTCTNAASRARSAFDTLSWNERKQRYDAANTQCTGTTSCAVGIGLFADTFYAAVLGLSAGLGLLPANATRVKMHLATQLKNNCVSFATNKSGTPGVCPVGMVLFTGREVSTFSSFHAPLS